MTLSVTDVVLIVVVLAVAAIAVRRFAGSVRGTRDCCSGASKGGESVRMPRPVDTEPSHYPYESSLRVGGMTCERCAARVAGALNDLGGTWAEVDLATATARVRSKAPLDEAAARDAVESAGYELLGLSR